MSKSIFSGGHTALVAVLKDARRVAGVSQSELARRVGRTQSFVAVIERGERRVDVVEFHAIAAALEHDPVDLFARVVAAMPEHNEI